VKFLRSALTGGPAVKELRETGKARVQLGEVTTTHILIYAGNGQYEWADFGYEVERCSVKFSIITTRLSIQDWPLFIVSALCRPKHLAYWSPSTSPEMG
jgi:hypothetical protein